MTEHDIRNKNVIIRLTEFELAHLDYFAAERHVSRSEFMRWLLREKMDGMRYAGSRTEKD